MASLRAASAKSLSVAPSSFFHAHIIAREELTIAPRPLASKAPVTPFAPPPCAPYPGTKTWCAAVFYVVLSIVLDRLRQQQHLQRNNHRHQFADYPIFRTFHP